MCFLVNFKSQAELTCVLHVFGASEVGGMVDVFNSVQRIGAQFIHPAIATYTKTKINFIQTDYILVSLPNII